ncbi:MAG: C4-type zinc ribbon domain-containing protein [Candidatus Omnitrophica bacterium]|nr:C4-type zinc ribbon domain-containing protein [Candidatus Omnitrophota bacterium]
MSEKNVQEQINKLKELQKIDKQIYDAENALEGFPEKLGSFNVLITEKESIFKDAEEKLKNVQVEQKERELELATKESQISKYEGQLLQLKTNQEYRAMQHEIASVKGDKSRAEEEILKGYDKVEEAKKELESKKSEYEKEKQKIEASRLEIEKQQKEFEQQLVGLKEGRKEKESDVDQDLLSIYKRLVAAKEGVGIVPLMGNACGGCNMSLPPQVVNEVRLGNKIIYCGNCSRILYWEQEIKN